MAFGRKKDREADLAAAGFITPGSSGGSNNKESSRTSSYPQFENGVQNGAAPVSNAPKTTSYRSSAQYNARGYETIN